jgi:hypothetical protein
VPDTTDPDAPPDPDPRPTGPAAQAEDGAATPQAATLAPDAVAPSGGGTEGQAEAPGGEQPGAPLRPRIARSAGGQLLAAAMLGLRDALEGRPREEVPIVVDAPGEPHPPDEFDLQLDFEHPERSRVVLRRPVGDDLDRPGAS